MSARRNPVGEGFLQKIRLLGGHRPIFHILRFAGLHKSQYSGQGSTPEGLSTIQQAAVIGHMSTGPPRHFLVFERRHNSTSQSEEDFYHNHNTKNTHNKTPT
jgi:hypothetical protein